MPVPKKKSLPLPQFRGAEMLAFNNMNAAFEMKLGWRQRTWLLKNVFDKPFGRPSIVDCKTIPPFTVRRSILPRSEIK